MPIAGGGVAKVPNIPFLALAIVASADLLDTWMKVKP
jgi:hypothetical protein